MGHLVEHLLLHPKNKNNISEYMYRNNISWTTHSEHIYIDYDEFLFDQNAIKKYLNTTITQDILDYEYDIFEEEFAKDNYINRSIDKFYQKRYNKQTSSKPTIYTINEVNKYIYDNIIIWEYLFFDNKNNTIIDTNIKYNTIISKNYTEEFNKNKIILEWKINYFFYKKISSWFDFVVANFLCDFLDMCDRFTKRYNMWSYFISKSYIYNDANSVGIINLANTSDISESFFENYKNYYIKYINNNYLEINNVSSIIYNWQYIPKEEMIKCILGLDYEYARKLI